jgi:hypothetical protein
VLENNELIPIGLRIPLDTGDREPPGFILKDDISAGTLRWQLVSCLLSTCKTVFVAEKEKLRRCHILWNLEANVPTSSGASEVYDRMCVVVRTISFGVNLRHMDPRHCKFSLLHYY